MNDTIKALAKKMKIKEKNIPFSQFKNGINVETEHKDVTGGDLTKTAKIAMAHLKESKNYYKALKTMEKSFEGKAKKTKKAVSKGVSKKKKN